MEAPTSLQADEIRNRKADVCFKSDTYNPEEVKHYTVRGQYDDMIKGKLYQDKEKGVDANSNTETFVAMKFYLDNWRWQGVLLRSHGQKNAGKQSSIVIQFQPVPHSTFSFERHDAKPLNHKHSASNGYQASL
jgi:glucose-6-phosphate 1-dehydrogenase